jgi:hypothetical protein
MSAAYDYLRNQPAVRALQRYAKRALGVFRWSMAGARATAGQGTGKRLLVVYDLASQPFSVGDILVFQEASLVLCERHGLQTVDFAVVYDPEKPVMSYPVFSHIDAGSFLFHLSSILPAAQVNPRLGSVLVLDSRRFLESLIAGNGGDYRVWPSMGLYAGREYLLYHCFNELFHDFYRERGALPNLASRPAARRWAESFIAKHAGSQAAVSVQLRRNPVNPERNSDYDSWLAFFAHCAGRYPVKFIVICSASELDPRLDRAPNVVVAKHHHTTLEQDLALIEAAAIHMGAASGPGTIAQFNRKPYCIFAWKINPALFRGVTRNGHRYRFSFATDLQSWLVDRETPESLVAEFERMWAQRTRVS